MGVAVIVDVPGGNEQLYEQLKLFPEGKLPEGGLMHLAGPTEKGWRVAGQTRRGAAGRTLAAGKGSLGRLARVRSMHDLPSMRASRKDRIPANLALDSARVSLA